MEKLCLDDFIKEFKNVTKQEKIAQAISSKGQKNNLSKNAGLFEVLESWHGIHGK